MSDKLRPLAKCVHGQRQCLPDVQYAGELAFSDALQSLGWSKALAARKLGVALNTVKSWCDKRSTPDAYVLMACEEFAAVWLPAFVARYREITRRAA